jgi:phage terminase small subunit
MAEEVEQVELTDKQEKFCYEYCFDFNATQAAIRAGYSENTARSIASQLLTKVNIQEKIKAMQDNLAETAGISRLKVLSEHMKLAFNSIAHLHNTWINRKDFESLTEDQKSCIAEISTQTKIQRIGEELVDVDFVKIKLYDKQKALDSISKMLGFDAPIKTELTGKDGKPLIPQKITGITFNEE